jgi:transcriptional regulator with PAS, ATPase and Fis domain
VVVNCGAIPKDLIESEFFGHAKGAFTDARSETTGKFELAQGGTIFLDEIGELSAEAQVKLLRVLGEREIVKVGGAKTISVDVRVIAATNKRLDEEVGEGRFREDLYYRLAVLSVHLPPLRERTEDIPLLCEHFLKKYRRELNKTVGGVSGPALSRLTAYPWPGNVRELENAVYEAMVLCDDGDVLDEADLPLRIAAASGPDPESGSFKKAAQRAAGDAEREMIERALREASGSRTVAAKALGISRKTLFNKMRSLGLN